MKKKFTSIRTKKGHFEVVKDDEKYFLEYLQDKGEQTGKVGYLINKEGKWYLQEAFFDYLKIPHYDFRQVFRPTLPIDDEIRKDPIDNLISACYQIEDAINLKGYKKCFICPDHHKKFWEQFIKSLRNGTDITTAYFEAGGSYND